tara:strand:+ start:461 stop:649 length:189 start_codon:yes stop_codon:yes gene_type:complete
MDQVSRSVIGLTWNGRQCDGLRHTVSKFGEPAAARALRPLNVDVLHDESWFHDLTHGILVAT